MYVICLCTRTSVRVHIHIVTRCPNAERSVVVCNTALPLPVVGVKCVVCSLVSEAWCVYVENAHECVCVCVCVYRYT